MSRDRRDELYYTFKCRHFNGIQHDACEIGIPYDSVRDPQPKGMTKYPCLILESPPAATVCEHLSRYTADESRQMCIEDNAAIDKLLADLAAGKCPTCGVAVEEETQVGPCVYAKPCGHRLGQGNAKSRSRGR